MEENCKQHAFRNVRQGPDKQVALRLVPNFRGRSHRQRIIANDSLGIDFNDVVDHSTHGVLHDFKIVHRRSEKREGPLAANAGQDNQTGVNVFGSDECAKIARIFGNDDKFASYAAS